MSRDEPGGQRREHVVVHAIADVRGLVRTALGQLHDALEEPVVRLAYPEGRRRRDHVRRKSSFAGPGLEGFRLVADDADSQPETAEALQARDRIAVESSSE